MFFFALRYLHRLVFETARTNYFPYLKTSCVLEDFLAFFKTFFLPVIFIQLKLRRPWWGFHTFFDECFYLNSRKSFTRILLGKITQVKSEQRSLLREPLNFFSNILSIVSWK